MKITLGKTILLITLILFATVLVWKLVLQKPSGSTAVRRADGSRPAPVEVMPIKQGEIEFQRTFSGTLEPRAEFVVAPKVAGRVVRMNVNIADSVKRNQEVGELDNDEYVQVVTQAKADLAVARANLAEAKSTLEVAERELSRTRTLRERGVASEAQLDTTKANQLAKQVGLNAAEAQLVHAEAALETANIRLGYTRITANWSGGEEQRVVAERFVDEGEMVAANSPLLRIVELDPIIGVIFVTERDYALLQPGQLITLTTDAFPGETFQGQIERIAPIFQQATRQARVELIISNPDQRLKPGMFIRATAILARKENTTIVPEQALTRRDNQTGVFLVAEDGKSVSWREVRVGIRNEDQVEILDRDLSGRVVTLGQQLLGDGSAITIPAPQPVAPPTN